MILTFLCAQFNSIQYLLMKHSRISFKWLHNTKIGISYVEWLYNSKIIYDKDLNFLIIFYVIKKTLFKVYNQIFKALKDNKLKVLIFNDNIIIIF